MPSRPAGLVQLLTARRLNSWNRSARRRTLQIRHLYTHQNGIVDAKFRHYFPATNLNDEYPMTLGEFLKSFEHLAESAEAVDHKARKAFDLSLYS